MTQGKFLDTYPQVVQSIYAIWLHEWVDVTHIQWNKRRHFFDASENPDHLRKYYLLLWERFNGTDLSSNAKFYVNASPPKLCATLEFSYPLYPRVGVFPYLHRVGGRPFVPLEQIGCEDGNDGVGVLQTRVY